MQKYEIGELDETGALSRTEKQRAFEESYRELRRRMISLGYFNPSMTYYALKLLSNLVILAVAIYLAINVDSLKVRMFAGLLLGIFFQQSFYLQHDAAHHQLFKNRLYGDLMGIITGDLFQGFSLQWWKSKHSSHHAVPNVVAHKPEICDSDGDPDIKTMPIFAFTMKLAESARDNKLARFLIRFQAIYYFPFLAFSRFLMCIQSWVYVYTNIPIHSVNKACEIDRQRMPHTTLEKIALFLHHFINFWILSYMPRDHALAFWLISQMSGGFLFIIVFSLGHNGMPVYASKDRPDFWKLQVLTTRNITSNPFVDWFCGGLQYQIEHHLFPTLPRHSLSKVHPHVMKFCKENNIQVHETNMLVGSLEVLQLLSDVKTEFFKEFPN